MLLAQVPQLLDVVVVEPERQRLRRRASCPASRMMTMSFCFAYSVEAAGHRDELHHRHAVADRVGAGLADLAR